MAGGSTTIILLEVSFDSSENGKHVCLKSLKSLKDHLMIQANQPLLWELSTALLKRIHKCVSIFYRKTVETSWCVF